MWQRPTRITMGCKFVVVSNFWKSRRKKEFCNDYRIRLKCFFILIFCIMNIMDFWKYIELDRKMLEIQALYQVVNIVIYMISCFQDVFSFILVFTLNNIIEWQKIVCGQIRYKHEPAVHLSMPNNLNILDIRFFVLSLKNVSTLWKIVLHFSNIFYVDRSYNYL